MGTWHTAARVQALIEALPEGCGALPRRGLCGFRAGGRDPAARHDDPRVIRMRTFSKAYGWRASRIGYALGHVELIAAFDRVRNHFGVNRIAQAGALAALADQDHLAQVRRSVWRRARTDRRDRAANGLTALPSATNFVAIDCGRDGAAPSGCWPG
jgi:histidinol-phosphate aminotransferase